MKRYGAIVGLREEHIARYKELHEKVWDGVLATIRKCNIHNYSIFLRRMPDGKHYLFAYYEYTGSDFAADMAKMAADPVTQEWWSICKPIQEPIPGLPPGEWWGFMEEVFHTD